MNLPTTGRVVIIDDELKEAMPLIRVLSQKGVAVRYFEGDYDTLPEKPLDGIRLVFLDIEIGTPGQDDKSKVSKVIGILRKIIGKESFPYILVAWTKHTELLEDLKSKLDFPPLKVLNMNKIDCKDSEGNYNLEIITSNLKNTMNLMESFNAFLLWEELLNKAANNTVNDTFSLCDINGNWNSDLQNILYNIAKADQGKQLNENILNYALKGFNKIYVDHIETSLSKKNSDFEDMPLLFEDKNPLSIELIAKLNTKILCLHTDEEDICPGNLYSSEKNGLDVSLLVNDFEKISSEWVPENILLEVTPSCDYAQDKWKFSRVLKGIVVPIKYDKKIKKADYIYRSKIVNIKGEIVYLIFDLRDFGSISFESLRNHSIHYQMRHQFLVDIQSKMANHISRPGYFAL